MRVDDIVSADRRPKAAPAVRRDGLPALFTVRTSRRRFLKGAVATGVGLGFSSLRLFPLAPPAVAVTEAEMKAGYQIYPYSTSGPCKTDAFYDANYTPDSSGYKCGPSPLCGTSPHQGCCNTESWHGCCGNCFNGACYYLRPNLCYNGTKAPDGSGWDGWRWKGDGGTIYRCHDGTTCWEGGCGPTVCRKTF